jgi:hypothetical protein
MEEKITALYHEKNSLIAGSSITPLNPQIQVDFEKIYYVR